MLTYNDCLGLSDLSREEVAALARIRHLPEIVALELGWCLCGTPEGRHSIRRMILDAIEDACRRGDTRAAAGLGLVLHHFLEGHCAEDHPAAPHAGGDDALTRTLDLDPAAAHRLRERLDATLAAMLRRFGLDRASVRERFPTEAHVAELCCAACAETGRCARFLAGVAGAEAPSAFCPNAALFDELRRSLPPSRDAVA